MRNSKYYLSFKSILILVFIFVANNLLTAQNCTVNSGVPETICDNHTMQLNGNADGLFSVDATWSQIGGPSVSITNPALMNSDVTGFIGGETYTFRISATCQDGVNIHDDVTITVNPVSQADAGDAQESCPGTITLAANSPGANETGLWSIISNDGNVTILTTTLPNSGVTLPTTSAGVSTLRWTITHDSNACNTFDEVTISNYGAISMVNAGDNQNLSHCYTSTQSTYLDASFAGNGLGGQQGTWTMVSGPNYPTIVDEHIDTTQITGLIEGIYIFRWDVSGSCVNGDDEVTITVPEATQDISAANADDIRFCYNATTAVLEGSHPQYANEVGYWTQEGGPAGVTITSPSSATTGITGLDGISDYRFTYTISNPLTNCSDQDADVRIRYAEAPTIDAGPDKIVDCGKNSELISTVHTGGTNTRYKIISGPSTSNWLDCPTDVTISNLNSSGTYIVHFERYAPGIGCTSALDAVNIFVSASPSLSNAGTDQHLRCNDVETDLAGNPPGSGTGMWSQVSGPNTANIATADSETSHIDGLIEGVYEFRWVITGGNSCPVEDDEVTVIVSTSVPSVAAGTNKNVCHSSEVILEGNVPDGNATGAWTVSPNSGITFSNSADAHSSVFGMQAGLDYTFTWTISNQCQVETDDVVIHATDIQGPSLAYAGDDKCENSGTINIGMDGNNPAVGTGLWTIIDGPNSPTITDNTLYNTTITGMIDGHYEIEWSINVESCSSTRDTLFASIVTGTTVSDADEDKSICGSSVVMTANLPATNETGHWEQVSGSSNYTISNVSAHDATFSDLLPGRYEFEWIIEKGICPSSTDSIAITVSEEPDDAITSSNYSICGSTNATISANNPIIGSGVWSQVGAGTNKPSVTSINSPTTTVTGMATGQYQFRWTITAGPDCTAKYDDITISVSAPAVAEPDRDLCNTTETFLEGTDGTDGVWTLVSGTPIPDISNTNVHTAYISNMGPDASYDFRYTVPEIYGCPSSSDDLTINTSSNGSEPDAGPNQEICTSNGTSITMAGNVPVSGNGEWVQISGPNSSTIVATSANDTEVTGLIDGIYVFEWNIDYNYCSNYSDVMRVTVSAPPTVSDAGDDQDNACKLNAQLEGNLPDAGIGTWTLISSPAANTATIEIDNLNTHNSGISNPSHLGTYGFRWTITNGSICSASTDDVNITFAAEPPSTPDANDNQDLCGADFITMAGNDPTIGVGTWSQISGPAGITIVSPTVHNTVINGIVPGTYEFRWEIVSGGCTLSDNMIVVNQETGQPADASGTDTEICQVGPLDLVGNNPSPGTGTWTVVSGPTSPIITNPNNSTTNVTGTTSGTYTFKWSIDNGSCPNSEDDVTITNYQIPTSDAGDNDENCGNTYNLIANDPAAGTGQWSTSGSGIFANGTLYNSQVTNLDFGSNTLVWTVSNGVCTPAVSQVIITANEFPSSTLGASGNTVCYGNNGTITVALSESGVDYEAYTGTTPVGSVSGDGANVDITVLATNLNTGANTFDIVATNATTNCSSNLDNQATITVNPNPISNQTVSGNTICTGSNGTVTIESSENNIDYEAFIGTTSVGTATGDGANINITILASDLSFGSNTIDIEATNSGTNCSINLDNQATITVKNEPESALVVSGNTVCDGNNGTATIIASESSASYEAFIGATSVGTAAGTGGNIDIDISSAELNVGNNTINFVSSLVGCSIDLDNQATIIVNANPVNDLSVTGAEVCEGTDASVLINSSENSINYEAFIDASSVATGVGDGNNLNITISQSDLAVGNNLVTIVATNPSTTCSSNLVNTGSIVVNSNPLPDLTVSGNTVCTGSNGTITIESSENNVDYEAFIGATTVGTGSGNDANIDISVSSSELSIGANIINIVATNSITNCSSNLNNQATITVKDNPKASLAVSGNTICEGNNGTITILASESGASYEAFIGATSVGTATGTGSDIDIDILPSGLNIGENTVTLTSTLIGCSVNLDNTATINVNANPINSLSVTGDEICEGNDASVLINSSENNINYVAFIDAGSVATSVGDGSNLSLTITQSDLTIGNNLVTIIATNPSTTCSTSLLNTGSIVVNANPVSDLTITTNEICSGEDGILTVNSSESGVGYALYIGSNTVGNGTGNGSDLDITIDESSLIVGNNLIDIIATNITTSCTSNMDNQGELPVKQCRIIVFDGFSPNDDGKNDYFKIRGLDEKPNHSVTIFNRWGNKVYEASPYFNDWDGTNMFGISVGGDKLPVGTYFYIIDLGDGSDVIKGYLYLNK